MNFLTKIFHLGATFSILKNWLIAVLANTLIGILMFCIVYYQHSWLGVAINIFFLYLGASYVYTWHALTKSSLLAALSIQPVSKPHEDPEEINSTRLSDGSL